MAKFQFESQGSKNYLVYTIDSSNEIDTMSLGMLTNNKIAGLAPTHFMQMNADRFVKYDISSKISVTNYFAGSVSRKKLIYVLEGICKALLSAEEYMLDESNVVLDMDYIFIDVTTHEVNVICLPTVNGDGGTFGIFLKNLMFNTQFDQSENCDYIAHIMNFLNKGKGFSLSELRTLLEELKRGIPVGVSNPQPVVQSNPNVTVHEQPVAPVPTVTTPPKTQENNAPIQQQTVVTPQSSKPVLTQPIGTSGNVVSAQQTNGDGKQIGLFGLLTHYSKENLELYKAQKAAKKVEQPSAPKVKEKPAKAMPQAGFAIPGQTVPQSPVMEKGRKSIPAQPSPMVSPVMKTTETTTHTSDQPTPQVQPVSQVNFGETTVLGGGTNFGETTVLNGTASVPLVREPFLIRKKTGEKIPINKPVFRIGKERSFVDYFIADNTAISRSHANIITKNQVYYVTDTNSTNHTYVNGKLIASNVETPISSGDIIKLANEEFCFELL